MEHLVTSPPTILSTGENLADLNELPTSVGYTIRSAEPEDLPGVQSLLRPFVEQRLILRRTKAELQVLLATGFVVLWEQQIVGFASIEVYSRKLAEIQCLAVSEPHQGKGLGASLVRRCVDLAREMRVMEVLVISSSDQFLINHGFNYALPNQKKALFLQLRSRDEVYRELEESGDE
jgi:amino-acid N-acetyltransferase